MKIEEKPSSNKGCLQSFTHGIGLVALIAALIFGGYLFLRGAGAYLIIADKLQPAQAIVILSGGDESRMQEALSLYKDKYGKVIILTETGQLLGKYNTLYSNDIRIQLLNHGVPNGDILITNAKVSSTLDEAFAIKNLLTNQQFSSAIIVTDPYHTRRTALVFRNVFGDSPIKLIFRPVRNSWYNSKTWFLSFDGWKYTFLEYAKLAGYYLGIKEG